MHFCAIANLQCCNFNGTMVRELHKILEYSHFSESILVWYIAGDYKSVFVFFYVSSVAIEV